MKLRTNLSHGRLLLAVAALSFSSAAARAQFMGSAVTSPPQPAGAPIAAMNAEHREIKIAPGDIIAISTLGVPELTTTAQTSSGSIAFGSNAATMQGIKVGSAGEVLLPYLGTVKLAGLTPTQAAALLRSGLKQAGILVDPQVSVELVDSPTRAVTVLGEVMKPSPVPAFGEIRLLDAISACGGFTPFASHSVTVRRVGESAPITVELGTDAEAVASADIPLMPGDTVIVSKVGSVFVLGYVKLPAAIPLAGNAPITVLRALTMAGGVNYGAALSKARIIRTTADNQRIEIRLDLKKIMFGQQQDVVLLSNDILLVPANAFKAGMAAGGAGVAASLLYAASDTATIFK
jgi:polysaccharide export outer membrane protein